MDFEAILNDDKTYPDTAEITLGDKKVALGVIRDMSRKQQKLIADKLADAEKQRTDAAGLAAQAAELHTKLTKQLDELQAGGGTGGGKGNEVTDDFDNDPFWQPLTNKKLKPIQETIAKLAETQKQLATAVQRAATMWAEDRWEQQYDRMKDRLKDPKYKDFTFEKVRDYAAERKLLDRHGFPSIIKAVEDITREDEIERIKREAREEGVKEGLQKSRLSTMQRPTSATGPAPQAKDSVVATKGLEGLGDDVAKDPELMNMLQELGALGPEDIVQ